MPGGSFCDARSRGSIPVGPVVTALKSGLNVDLTEKILLMSMCRFSVEFAEHPTASNNVAAHTTPLSVFAIDIGAMYRSDGVSLATSSTSAECLMKNAHSNRRTRGRASVLSSRPVCSLQAADQGFADLMTLNVPGARNCRSIVIAPNAGIVELIHRAKATGRLRDDFVAEDLVLLQMANSGVLA